jgi:hypothetical protein
MTHSELFERIRVAIENDAAAFSLQDCCFRHFFSLVVMRMSEDESSEILRRLAVRDTFNSGVSVTLLHRWENDCESGSEVLDTHLGVRLTKSSNLEASLHVETDGNFWELIPKGSPGYVSDDVYGQHLPAFN